jgi:hypothetical protein
LAQETKLDRNVALMVLGAEVAAIAIAWNG